MDEVTLSDKYQVVIPRRQRERLRLRKRQKMVVIEIEHGLVLMPEVDIAEMEGIFPGLPLDGIREEDDRL